MVMDLLSLTQGIRAMLNGDLCSLIYNKYLSKAVWLAGLSCKSIPTYSTTHAVALVHLHSDRYHQTLIMVRMTYTWQVYEYEGWT